MAASFATPDQFAAMTGTEVDPDVQPLLDAASALIRRYCGWHIAPVLVEDVVADGTGARITYLPTLHLLDVTALSETSSGGTVTQYIPPADLPQVQWSRDGFLRKTSPWTEVLQGITATIEHGYDLAAVPDLTALTCTMAARSMASPFGEKQQTVGSVTVALSSGATGTAGGLSLYDDQMALLDSYRLFGRP